MNKEDGRRLLREWEKWHSESATEPETIALVPVELEEMGVWTSPSEAGVNYFCANHPHSPFSRCWAVKFASGYGFLRNSTNLVFHQTR